MDRRRIEWRGSTYRDLCAMPEDVRRTFGYALGLAQNDLRFEHAKTLTAFSPPLIELVEDDDGDTYRAVYTAHYAEVVYVIHCFQKKSTRGRNLPKRDKATIEARLAEVRRIEATKAAAKRKGQR